MTYDTEMMVKLRTNNRRICNEVPFADSFEGNVFGFCLSFLKILLIAFHIEEVFLRLSISLRKYNALAVSFCRVALFL